MHLFGLQGRELWSIELKIPIADRLVRLSEGRMQIVRLVISSYALARLLAAQPSLRITSPAEGTTVHPSKSLTVTVEVSPPEATFVAVLVVAPDPLGFGKPDPYARPYRFTIQMSEHAPPKKYSLAAMEPRPDLPCL
jgi:hypothetical protein